MAKIVSRQVMDDVRARSDIADVIGSYIRLQRAGTSHKGLCPFHKEKTPSFHVNPRRQSFHCFGCGAGGDVFSFVMMHEGVDFMSAVRLLADRAGVRLELEEDGGEKGPDKALLFKIHEEAAQFFRRCLLTVKEAEVARAYLKKRDLEGDIAEQFLIGYAPDRWDSMEQLGRKHGYSRELLEQCGLIVRREKEGGDVHHYDRFRGRVMFPVRDEQARIIAFSGRILESQAEAAKYVNSPETPLFRKSRVLYAIDRARRAIADAGEAIVCEGQIDVIRCHQHGFTTAVASQGTAFTAEHARVLNRYADSVVLVFDPDTAGQTAAVKTARIFLEAGLAVRVASLPQGEDPDDFLRTRGAEAFKAILAAAAPAVVFQARMLKGQQDVRSEAGAMRAARAVLETVAASPNAVQRTRMIEEASEQLGVPVTALAQELQRMARAVRPPPEARAATTDAAPAAVPPPPPHELALCEHVAHVDEEQELAELIEKYLPLPMISDPRCRSVVAAALEAHRWGRELTDLLREQGATEETMRLAALAATSPVKVRGEEVSRLDAVRDFILEAWRRRLKAERDKLDAEATGGMSAEARARRQQLTLDLKALTRWKEGSTVIELEVGV